MLTFSRKSKCLGLEVLWPRFPEPEGDDSGRLRGTVPARAPTPATSRLCPHYRHGQLARGFRFLAASPTLLGTPHHRDPPAGCPDSSQQGQVCVPQRKPSERAVHTLHAGAETAGALQGSRTQVLSLHLWTLGRQGRAVVDRRRGTVAVDRLGGRSEPPRSPSVEARTTARSLSRGCTAWSPVSGVSLCCSEPPVRPHQGQGPGRQRADV